VRSVELRPVNLLTSSAIQNLVDPDATIPTPETRVSATAPWQFRKVQDGYIYPKSVGYATDRVELYLEADLGVENNGRIEVSGIHWASSEAIDVSSDNFTVLAIDTPPWDDRVLPNKVSKHDPEDDQLSGVTISHAYTFTPETSAPTTWSSRRRLQTRRKVDSYEILETTVTLTMNATHHFEVGDIILVDIFAQNATAYGADGLFYITAVTSNTIEYELAAGVDTPVLSTDVSSSDVYVFPVAREWAQVGSIWVDSTTDRQYYWDGIRWVDYTTDTVIGKDGDPPAPVTNLAVASEALTAPVTYLPYAKVTLTWTAPTTTQAGSQLTDLAGYTFKWRKSTLDDWQFSEIDDPTITSFVFDDSNALLQNQLYYFEVLARDSGGEISTAATISHTTALTAGDHTVYAPTAPTAVSRLGTIKVSWDGRLFTGVTTVEAPENIVSLNIHMSTLEDFTPSASTLVEAVRIITTGGGFGVLTDLTYGTPYYFKITVTDSAGVTSAPSAQVTAQVQPLVNTDLIANTLTTWPFAGQVVSASALADGSVSASKLLPGAVQAEALAANAVTSLAIAADAVTAASIAANAVTGPAIASSAITAGKIAAGAVAAESIQAGAITSEKITAGAIGANQIAADAITASKISAGAIGADKIAAGAIIAGKLAANSVTAGTVAALAISAGSIQSNAITADKIDAGAITAVKIAADAITADKIDAGAITADAIAATTITADKFAATLAMASNMIIQDANPTLGRIELRGNSALGPRGIVAFKNSGGGVANSAFRFYTDGNSYLDDVEVAGTLSVSGSVTGGTFTGGTFRTSAGTYGRVNISSSTTYGVTGALNFESSGQYIRGLNGMTVSDTIGLGDYASGTATTNLVYVNRLNGQLQISSSASDERLKEKVENLGLGLEMIKELRPVKFVWKQDHNDKEQWGFIAQEARPVLEANGVDLSNNPVSDIDYSRMVEGDNGKEGSLTFKESKLVPVLVQAIKDLSSQLEELKDKVEYLESNQEK
jgi:hypothetical protein